MTRRALLFYVPGAVFGITDWWPRPEPLDEEEPCPEEFRLRTALGQVKALAEKARDGLTVPSWQFWAIAEQALTAKRLRRG